MRLLSDGLADRELRSVLRGGGPQLQQSVSRVETLRDRDGAGKEGADSLRRLRGPGPVPWGLVVPLRASPTQKLQVYSRSFQLDYLFSAAGSDRGSFLQELCLRVRNNFVAQPTTPPGLLPLSSRFCGRSSTPRTRGEAWKDWTGSQDTS